MKLIPAQRRGGGGGEEEGYGSDLVTNVASAADSAAVVTADAAAAATADAAAAATADAAAAAAAYFPRERKDSTTASPVVEVEIDPATMTFAMRRTQRRQSAIQRSVSLANTAANRNRNLHVVPRIVLKGMLYSVIGDDSKAIANLLRSINASLEKPQKNYIAPTFHSVNADYVIVRASPDQINSEIAIPRLPLFLLPLNNDVVKYNNGDMSPSSPRLDLSISPSRLTARSTFDHLTDMPPPPSGPANSKPPLGGYNGQSPISAFFNVRGKLVDDYGAILLQKEANERIYSSIPGESREAPVTPKNVGVLGSIGSRLKDKLWSPDSDETRAAIRSSYAPINPGQLTRLVLPHSSVLTDAGQDAFTEKNDPSFYVIAPPLIGAMADAAQVVRNERLEVVAIEEAAQAELGETGGGFGGYGWSSVSVSARARTTPLPLPEPRGDRRRQMSFVGTPWALNSDALKLSSVIGDTQIAALDTAAVAALRKEEENAILRPMSSQSGFAHPSGGLGDGKGLGPYSDVGGPQDDIESGDERGEEGGGGVDDDADIKEDGEEEMVINDESIVNIVNIAKGLSGNILGLVSLDGGDSLGSIAGPDFSLVDGEGSIRDNLGGGGGLVVILKCSPTVPAEATKALMATKRLCMRGCKLRGLWGSLRVSSAASRHQLSLRCSSWL